MIRLLSAVLVIQLILVAVLYWPRLTAREAPGALVDTLAREEISRITIEGDDDAVTLSRDDDGWILASGLPADTDRVTTLLGALLATDPGFAIADSSAAAARFEVADDDFERRIELAGDGASAVVYLGTSPSFRKIHARRDGDSAVYVIELNSFDAPTGAGEWLDRTLLAARDLTAIGLYGVDYELEDEGWQRADGEAVDAGAMEELLQVLASLRVSGIEEADDDALVDAGESLRIDLSSGGERFRLTVLDNPEEERFYLRSDRFDETFGTSAYDAERLIDAARAVAGMTDEEDDAQADGAAAGEVNGGDGAAGDVGATR